MGNFLAELQRRNVFRVAGGYAVVAWLLSQMASLLEDAMNMPAWFDTVVVSFLLLGFPIALILAWAFESTPEGIRRTENVDPNQSITRETGRKLDYVLIIGLLLVGILIIGDRLLPSGNSQGNLADSTSINKLEGQSIAVLPFEDFSPENDQVYFANGIAEELLNVLARVDGLRVASRTSAFSFQDREISIAEIGKALNVTHILEGSVRKAGETLRITAQLIDTSNDEHLWSETYDRPLTAENIFEVQDEISKSIVLALNGHLDLIPESNEISTRSTQAFDAYLKGKEAYATRSVEGIENGLTELIRAVTIDPDFAQAHAKLSRAYSLVNTYGEITKDAYSERAQIHIQRALELASTDWDVLSEYAWWLQEKRNRGSQEISLKDVLSAFEDAIIANKNNAEAYRGKGWTLALASRYDEAKSALEIAKTLNPKDPLIYLNLAGVADGQGDPSALLNLSVQAIKVAPSALYIRSSLGVVYSSRGEFVSAHKIFQSCLEERACGLALGDIYAGLGIEVNNINIVSDDYTLVTQYYAAGDFEQVAELVSNSKEITVRAKTTYYASIGRWNKGYQLIQASPALFEPYIKGKSGRDRASLETEVAILAIFQQLNDPRAQALRESLSKKFQDIALDKQTDTYTHLVVAAWHTLNQDPDSAITWLSALSERGVSTPIYFEPIFKPLEARDDYQRFVARMDENMNRDRTLIQAQLDNPPEIWWSVDDLPD